MDERTVRAWHGDAQLKAAQVARMRDHCAADEFAQRAYILLDPDKASGFRGCFHVCLTAETVAAQRGVRVQDLDSHTVGWHREGERLWGIPHRLGAVLDHMFEGLPEEDCAGWAVEVTEAVPVGADLTLVVDRWLLDLLADPDGGVLRHTAEGSDERGAIGTVAGLYRRRLAGDEPAAAEWESARGRASFGTLGVAYAAAAAAERGDPAFWAAEVAGEAAVAAERAGVSLMWTPRWQAERLLHHIRTAPVPGEGRDRLSGSHSGRGGPAGGQHP